MICVLEKFKEMEILKDYIQISLKSQRLSNPLQSLL